MRLWEGESGTDLIESSLCLLLLIQIERQLFLNVHRHYVLTHRIASTFVEGADCSVQLFD